MIPVSWSRLTCMTSEWVSEAHSKDQIKESVIIIRNIQWNQLKWTMLQRRKGPIRRKDRKALWFGKLKNGIINFSFSNTSRVISVNLAALGVSSGNSMSVALFDTHDEGKSVSCCFTDEAGAHWCLKMIKNVNPGRFSNVFVCCGHLCNFKLFYASPSDFCVSGFHRCAFDHEREYRKRVRNQMAMDIIREHVILRPPSHGVLLRPGSSDTTPIYQWSPCLLQTLVCYMLDEFPFVFINSTCHSSSISVFNPTFRNTSKSEMLNVFINDPLQTIVHQHVFIFDVHTFVSCCCQSPVCYPWRLSCETQTNVACPTSLSISKHSHSYPVIQAVVKESPLSTIYLQWFTTKSIRAFASSRQLHIHSYIMTPMKFKYRDGNLLSKSHSRKAKSRMSPLPFLSPLWKIDVFGKQKLPFSMHPSSTLYIMNTPTARVP